MTPEALVSLVQQYTDENTRLNADRHYKPESLRAVWDNLTSSWLNLSSANDDFRKEYAVLQFNRWWGDVRYALRARVVGADFVEEARGWMRDFVTKGFDEKYWRKVTIKYAGGTVRPENVRPWWKKSRRQDSRNSDL